MTGFVEVSQNEMMAVDGGVQVTDKSDVIFGATLAAASLSVACGVAIVAAPFIAVATGITLVAAGVGFILRGTGN